LAACALLLGLAAAWRWTPLAEWLSADTLASVARAIESMPAAPAIVVAAYVVAGLVMVPLVMLIAATVAVFGPFLGFVYALAGAMASGVVTFALGHVLGRNLLHSLGGGHLERLRRRLARRGVLAVAAVRLVPIAPFTVVNLVAGALHIRTDHFIAGTVLGLTPGLTATALFTDGLLTAIHDPSPRALAVLVGLVAAMALGVGLVRRRFSDAA
jgi:uncharacterized membrane protein YdjX (TVP38/TMEM64 family)